MATILIPGGAGYIGSQMALMLHASGHEVIVYDVNTNSALSEIKCITADLSDRARLDKVFREHRIDAVIHFAAFIEVGESVQNPNKYFQNNVGATLVLLDAMVKHEVNKLIFSSTAAIFGEPQYTPIDEKHPKQPLNPYGQSKLIVEQLLQDYDKAHGLKSVCFRYFNAAGADPDLRTGECHDPETHVIPLLIQAALGKRSGFSIYGNDYDTPDGTCIRDYIHVVDLCDAHEKALNQLLSGAASAQYNLGNGTGFSVQQVIDAVEKAAGCPINVTQDARREGDPAVLVADSTVARDNLGWQPQYADLDEIVQHAFAFEKARK